MDSATKIGDLTVGDVQHFAAVYLVLISALFIFAIVVGLIGSAIKRLRPANKRRS